MRAWIVRGSMALGLLWIAGSYLGRLHPLGDSLAVFRVYVATATLLAAGLCWRWWAGRATAVLMALILAHRVLLGQEWTPVGQPTFTLYQKNLLYHETDRAPFLADVRTSDADFLTLQEVSRANLPLLDALRDVYPHQHLCPGRSVGGVAILSRHPLESLPCSDTQGLAQAVADTPNGRVRLIAVHLHWPYPYSQAVHVDRIVADLGGVGPEPVLLAGDFNMVPWGHAVTRIVRAAGTPSTGHVEPTWTRRGVGLMIDHVFAGPEANVEIDVRPRLGSDHMGVLARIAL